MFKSISKFLKTIKAQNKNESCNFEKNLNLVYHYLLLKWELLDSNSSKSTKGQIESSVYNYKSSVGNHRKEF